MKNRRVMCDFRKFKVQFFVTWSITILLWQFPSIGDFTVWLLIVMKDLLIGENYTSWLCSVFKLVKAIVCGSPQSMPINEPFKPHNKIPKKLGIARINKFSETTCVFVTQVASFEQNPWYASCPRAIIVFAKNFCFHSL